MTAKKNPRDYKGFLKSIIERRLDNYHGWPANVFKLECEGYGLYQNATGKVLSNLLDEGTIGKDQVKIREVERPIITRPDCNASDLEKEIETSMDEFDKFLSSSGYFADLAGYVALCKMQDELGSKINIDVLPEGPRPHLLHYPGRAPDGLVILPSEYVPVEIYNGKYYLGIKGRKYCQLLDLSSFKSVEEGGKDQTELVESSELNSHPLLINRRSDSIIKHNVRKMNGMVVDTDCIIACEDEHENIDDVLKLFNLSSIVELIPRLETSNGICLDGPKYNQITSDTGEEGILRPPSNMAAAADELPGQYLRRIRGGIQLQYVNSFYRQFTESTKRTACLVLQAIYNDLLREGGWDLQIALEGGWEDTIEKYPRIKSANARKDVILEETQDLIHQLKNEKIITERNGGLHARQATHPQQSLSF